MNTVEASAEIEIAAAPADVAGVMFDPQREPEWMKAVTGVELLDAALQPGARVRRTGRVMGRDVGWTTEVETVHFPHVLALKLIDGPITGALRYDIQRSGGGSRVRMRASGDPGPLAMLPEAMITGPIRTALSADLERLKAIVEGQTP